MKINKINNTKYNNNKTNFKAREYAAVKTITKDVVSELKLYEIGENDTKFLDVMSQRINLEKLAELKNATKRQLFKWKTMINNAIMMAGFDYPQRSFLLTKENRPCGIVSYRELPFDFYIDNIASWPVNKGENVKLAGTTLVKTAFENAKAINAEKINLSLLTESPVDLAAFYKKMNFVEVDKSVNSSYDMTAMRSLYIEKCRELDNIVVISKIEKPKDVNLKKALDINYRY